MRRYSDDDIKKIYSNSVIIIDEVHNLRNYNIISKKLGENNLYKIFNHFLKLLSNCKIILLSGTPMRDSAVEIIDIINLLKERKNELKKEDFFIEKKIDMYSKTI